MKNVVIEIELTPLELYAAGQTFSEHVYERNDKVQRARRRGLDKLERAAYAAAEKAGITRAMVLS